MYLYHSHYNVANYIKFDLWRVVNLSENLGCNKQITEYAYFKAILCITAVIIVCQLCPHKEYYHYLYAFCYS